MRTNLNPQEIGDPKQRAAQWKKGRTNLPFTAEFKADRPFVFLIREKSTDSVLFLGRTMTPQT